MKKLVMMSRMTRWLDLADAVDTVIVCSDKMRDIKGYRSS
jgi:hypothetical protein